MADSKPVALITGANSGIGLELVRQLISKPNPKWHVILASRSIEKGQAALDSLQAETLPGTVSLVQLDVTDDESIIHAARTASQTYGHLDVLVNNAGFVHTGERTRESMRASFETHVIGPMRIAEEFAPLLQKSHSPSGPRIVNVSSRAGSIKRRLDESNMTYDSALTEYRTSKAALNMLSVGQVWEYGRVGIRTFVLCPGFVESNLVDFARVEKGAKPVAEGIAVIVDVVEGRRDGEEGSFLVEGAVAEW